MAQRRAHSAERLDQNDGAMDRLANMLADLVNRPQPAPVATFKAPTFDGSSDVECFIRQFQDVCLANEWNNNASLLHVRTKLKGDAGDCGKGENIDAVYAALRSKYGITRREARNRLSNLKRNSRTTLYAHAEEVAKLVQVAYEESPENHRADMTLELFCNTINNTSLQRHLLAVPLTDLQSVVRAGNEYLQIQPGTTDNRTIQPEGTDEAVKLMTDPLPQLLRTAQQLTDEVEKLKSVKPRKLTPRCNKPDGSYRCFECNQEGHWRRDCPQKRNKPSFENKDSGNGMGPQQ